MVVVSDGVRMLSRPLMKIINALIKVNVVEDINADLRSTRLESICKVLINTTCLQQCRQNMITGFGAGPADKSM